MKILVIRFSAMGDVAMTLPAIHAFLAQNKDSEIYFISKKIFQPIFFNIPRLHFIGFDKNIHKGIFGFLKFVKFISTITKFDAVIDLHNSLRSRLISYFLKIKNINFYIIDKGKSEKRKLISKNYKKLFLLKHQTERYADVFNKFSKDNQLVLSNSFPFIYTTKYLHLDNSQKIGIAPLAAHSLKEWGIENYKNLLKCLINDFPKVSIYIFGGKSDYEILSTLLISGNIKLAINLPNKLYDELELISKLDIMVSNDSGNMHLAAMLGIKTLGIFGPTHPYLGFGAYHQQNNIVQDNNLTCRPCSVYGNNSCFRGDHACMKNISVEIVKSKINNILG
ncbi:MAG: glycosyltransferase family 9 protein [Cytophagales bacterium]|nr:MAG: glycosyltransferase family 9 protein [Cytophagales bacterium]